MIQSEPRDDDAVIDVPSSWWREHVHVAVWILVAGWLVIFVRFAAEVVVPFVLIAALFYALDPAVDALQRWHVPRAIGAALMLGIVVAGVPSISLTLRDDVAKIVVELPEGARRFGAALRRRVNPPSFVRTVVSGVSPTRRRAFSPSPR